MTTNEQPTQSAETVTVLLKGKAKKHDSFVRELNVSVEFGT